MARWRLRAPLCDAGADRLAVALVEEGVELREAGIDAPILLLSEPPIDSLADALQHSLTPTLYHPDTVAAAADLVGAAEGATNGSAAPWGVQVKVDTGMHRVGVTPGDAPAVVMQVTSSGRLALEGVFTHLAVADEPQREETDRQLALFEEVLAELRSGGIDPGLTHAANSAGLIAHRSARLDMVRVGIAAYGLPPAPELAGEVDLRPAMSVHAEVTHVHDVRAGEGVSYGLRHRFERDTRLAVIPLGYADGVRRALGLLGAEVLIGGVRRPIRGVVTMDQTVVEVGPVHDSSVPPVSVGDEVVLIGSQEGPGGTDRITADDWARLLDTVSYEIVCGFGPRLRRTYTGRPDVR